MTQAFESISLKHKLFFLVHVSLGSYVLYPMLLTDILSLQNVINPIWVQLIYSFIMLIPALYWMKSLILDSLSSFNYHPLKHSLSILKAFPLMMLVSLIFNGLAIMITHAEASTNQILLGEWFNQYPVLVIFEALIFAPIFEELLFRGFIYQVLKKINPSFGLWISSLLFGLAHMLTQSPLKLSDFAFLPTYTLLGFLLARQAITSKSLISSMGLHFLNNLLGIIALMLI